MFFRSPLQDGSFATPSATPSGGLAWLCFAESMMIHDVMDSATIVIQPAPGTDQYPFADTY
jgi:hypothetical protein